MQKNSGQNLFFMLYLFSRFKRRQKNMVNKEKCIGCGTCVAICPVGAISFDDDGKAKIDKAKCIHCGACEASCPVSAIKLD